MNKKDLIKIARTIYLQDSISSEIYAAMYNIGEPINQGLGSYRSAQGLDSCFQAFMGSKQRTPQLQFVEKNGDKYSIHKIKLQSLSTSDEFAAKDLSLRKVSYILRRLGAFLTTNVGSESLEKLLESLVKKVTKTTKQISSGKNGKNQFKNIDSQDVLQSYIDMINDNAKKIEIAIERLGKIVDVQQGKFFNLIQQFKNSINKINDDFNNGKLDLNGDNANNLTADFADIHTACLSISQFINNANVAKALKSISKNASRLNMLNTIYNQVCQQQDNSDSEEQRGFASLIKQAIESCNNNVQLNKEYANIAKVNLQNRYNLIDRSYIDYENNTIDRKKQYQLQNSKRYNVNAFILFLNGRQNNIATNVFEKAISQLMNQADTDQLYDALQKLDNDVEILKKAIQVRDANKNMSEGLIKKSDYDKIMQDNRKLLNDYKNVDFSMIESNDKSLYYSDIEMFDPQVLSDLQKQLDDLKQEN